MNWDEYFFDLIKVIKNKSKDERTKIGCIIAGPDNEIRSTGYNSFPRGINDYIAERQEPNEKKLWIAHAELNAICNAARVGIPLNGCTIYIIIPPCNICSQMIIGSGIKKIKFLKTAWENYSSPTYNKEVMEKSFVLLKEAGIELIGI